MNCMQGRKTGTLVDIDQQYLKHDYIWYITYTCISMVGLRSQKLLFMVLSGSV